MLGLVGQWIHSHESRENMWIFDVSCRNMWRRRSDWSDASILHTLCIRPCKLRWKPTFFIEMLSFCLPNNQTLSSSLMDSLFTPKCFWKSPLLTLVAISKESIKLCNKEMRFGTDLMLLYWSIFYAMGKSYVFILMKLPEGVVLSRQMIGPTIYFLLLSDFYSSFLQRQKIFNFQSTQEVES